jgi:hypothetical protein
MNYELRKTAGWQSRPGSEDTAAGRRFHREESKNYEVRIL